ncbi:mitoferrin-1 [Nilaparvata lugens]|uniref:mitoferrin-1 n=1 Tax=Nilaparvata lugens TaxID=108931 RepID=UPI000B98F81F|nr:mitoferrin-1 [Nilaparvata lugens]
MKKTAPIHHEAESSTNFISGSVAGIMENCFFYPLDTVKTRMQILSPNSSETYNSIGRSLYQLVKEGGLRAPYRGVGIMLIGCGPAHGSYFWTYEFLKTHAMKRSDGQFVYGICGAVATLVHDSIMVPCDTIKQRRQMQNSRYRSNWHCITSMLREEGVRAFYRSYTTQMTMNVPYQAIQFTVYELCSAALVTAYNSNEYSLISHVGSGALAGGVAGFVTTPLDVCKTLLNTQHHKDRVIGLRNSVKTVYRIAGPRGFFQGATARTTYMMASAAICWGTYESMKYLLR